MIDWGSIKSAVFSFSTDKMFLKMIDNGFLRLHNHTNWLVYKYAKSSG